MMKGLDASAAAEAATGRVADLEAKLSAKQQQVTDLQSRLDAQSCGDSQAATADGVPSAAEAPPTAEPSRNDSAQPADENAAQALPGAPGEAHATSADAAQSGEINADQSDGGAAAVSPAEAEPQADTQAAEDGPAAVPDAHDGNKENADGEGVQTATGAAPGAPDGVVAALGAQDGSTATLDAALRAQVPQPLVMPSPHSFLFSSRLLYHSPPLRLICSSVCSYSVNLCNAETSTKESCNVSADDYSRGMCSFIWGSLFLNFLSQVSLLASVMLISTGTTNCSLLYHTVRSTSSTINKFQEAFTRW